LSEGVHGHLLKGHDSHFISESFTLNLSDESLHIFTLNSVELRNEDLWTAIVLIVHHPLTLAYAITTKFLI